MTLDSYIVMILSQDCNIEKISSIAQKNAFSWEQKDSRKIWGEWNYIYEIKKLKHEVSEKSI